MAPGERNEADGGSPRTKVLRLVGIYHASGTPWGELSYWIKARFGGAHCSLCDITHTSVREKAEWKSCRATLVVPFETVHLDERDPDLLAFTDGHTPCVVAETEDGPVLLVDDPGLRSCAGSPQRMIELIETRAGILGLGLG
jgi:hypothetical protein